jgi:hypothetical protein
MACPSPRGSEAPKFTPGVSSCMTVTLLRCVGSCTQRRFARLPRGSAFFPLVIGELFDLSAVVAHDEDFAVRLRRSDQHNFVFETHAAAAKQETFSFTLRDCIAKHLPILRRLPRFATPGQFPDFAFIAICLHRERSAFGVKVFAFLAQEG